MNEEIKLLKEIKPIALVYNTPYLLHEHWNRKNHYDWNITTPHVLIKMPHLLPRDPVVNPLAKQQHAFVSGFIFLLLRRSDVLQLQVQFKPNVRHLQEEHDSL